MNSVQHWIRPLLNSYGLSYGQTKVIRSVWNLQFFSSLIHFYPLRRSKRKCQVLLDILSCNKAHFDQNVKNAGVQPSTSSDCAEVLYSTYRRGNKESWRNVWWRALQIGISPDSLRWYVARSTSSKRFFILAQTSRLFHCPDVWMSGGAQHTGLHFCMFRLLLSFRWAGSVFHCINVSLKVLLPGCDLTFFLFL